MSNYSYNNFINLNKKSKNNSQTNNNNNNNHKIINLKSETNRINSLKNYKKINNNISLNKIKIVNSTFNSGILSKREKITNIKHKNNFINSPTNILLINYINNLKKTETNKKIHPSSLSKIKKRNVTNSFKFMSNNTSTSNYEKYKKNKKINSFLFSFDNEKNETFTKGYKNIFKPSKNKNFFVKKNNNLTPSCSNNNYDYSNNNKKHIKTKSVGIKNNNLEDKSFNQIHTTNQSTFCSFSKKQSKNNFLLFKNINSPEELHYFFVILNQNGKKIQKNFDNFIDK